MDPRVIVVRKAAALERVTVAIRLLGIEDQALPSHRDSAVNEMLIMERLAEVLEGLPGSSSKATASPASGMLPAAHGRKK
jgi:hypothetical protein